MIQTKEDGFTENDIEQWCGATLQELSHAALDRPRQRWAAIVTMASDTNGR